MVPAHFHDVTHEKSKADLVKILQDHPESPLNQFKSENSILSRRAYPDNLVNLSRTRESSCGFGHVQTFFRLAESRSPAGNKSTKCERCYITILVQ